MWFFVFSINFARTREGRPARRKLTELLVKSKKTLVTEPAAIFFVFQVNISCKTTSIILYFKYASFSVVTRKKRQNTNPHPDGNFFDDRFGLGILRDEAAVKSEGLATIERSLLESVVEGDSLNIVEVELFKGDMEWTTKELEKLGLVADWQEFSGNGS